MINAVKYASMFGDRRLRAGRALLAGLVVGAVWSLIAPELFACIAAQDKSPDARPAQVPAEAADPMASFARMLGAEWKVTFTSGTSMYDTWHWGPGKHSMRVMTHGEDAAGNPWRALGVVYWHPGRKQLCTLGLNPYAGSVSEGTISVVGETTEAASELNQNGARRKIVSREVFDGPDKYHTALLEEIEPGKLMPLVEWDYFRSKTITPVQPLPTENPPKPSERLKALEPLLGHTWNAKGNWGEAPGSAFHIETTFEWIPYIDAIYARSFALRGNGEPTHLLDTYFYYHTGPGSLRCLALSSSGGVYEGDLTVLDGGALQIDLKGYEGELVVPYVVQFDFEKDGKMRHRVWTVNGTERTPMLDAHHTVSEMSKGIWYVFQDAKGNYWFGSDGQGVYRFDCTTITHFTTKDGLCNDRIRGIQQHTSGDILITTLDGVSKFDGQKFVTLPMTVMDSPDKGWVLDPDDVWLPWQTGQKGPYRYDGKTLYHLMFPKHPREDEFYATHPTTRPWSPYEVYCVYKDRKSNMWFGTSNFGICRFDGKHLDWMYEDHLTEIEGGGMFGIRSIFEDKDGAFWFCNTQFRYNVQANGEAGQNNGQITYTRENGMDLSGTSLREKFFYFMSITEDNNGDLWLATYGGGVWRYDGKSMTHYPVKDGDKDITLFSIYKDNRGDLWLGTHEAGAYKFNGKTFEKFDFTASVKQGDQVTSGIGLLMLYVEPQTFAMGSPKGDVHFNDQIQHVVTISKGYWLGETEVTQKMWREVMETEPWKRKEHVIDGDTVAATCMDWNEAVEFCRRLTLREKQAGRLPTGYEYCLPTETEWELACRAGSTGKYSFGDDAGRFGEFAVFKENRDGEHAHCVKTRKANGFGFFDMYGNVWEFCADEQAGSDVPGYTDGDLVRDPYSRGGEARVIRGCGFYSLASTISSPIRRSMEHSDRYVDTGFRPALATRSASK